MTTNQKPEQVAIFTRYLSIPGTPKQNRFMFYARVDRAMALNFIGRMRIADEDIRVSLDNNHPNMFWSAHITVRRFKRIQQAELEKQLRSNK
tara:strand:- start:667 stop:942 length:276 start_codon:yes stop_codon:yes gene_type:complete